jgi:NADP-dependent 3-hydroxy acid dehydrogenase YdfG
MELAGKVVIITGASSGIGAATARLVHSLGATPVLAARRAERLEALARELPGALVQPTDMRNHDEIHRLVSTTLARLGRIDVLVNNAGQGLHVPVAQVGLDDFIAVTELNVYGPLLAMQAVIPIMRRQGGGAIVNVSSGTTRMVLPGVGPYAATKSALNMLSLVAREEVAGDGIRVSVVYPSITATEFHQSLRAGQVTGKAKPGDTTRPTPHSAEYVAQAIVRAIRTGEAEIVVPPGPEPTRQP